MTTEPSRQHTLAAPAVFAGVGLHSGLHVRVAIRPAPAGAGVVFVRTDLKSDNVIACRGDMITPSRLSRRRKAV